MGFILKNFFFFLFHIIGWKLLKIPDSRFLVVYPPTLLEQEEIFMQCQESKLYRW